jgi:hypothetical protein
MLDRLGQLRLTMKDPEESYHPADIVRMIAAGEQTAPHGIEVGVDSLQFQSSRPIPQRD